jgi:hypothetical protein
VQHNTRVAVDDDDDGEKVVVKTEEACWEGQVAEGGERRRDATSNTTQTEEVRLTVRGRPTDGSRREQEGGGALGVGSLLRLD